MDKKLLTSIIVIVLFVGAFFAINKFMYNKEQNNITNAQTLDGEMEIIPIEHATMVLKWSDKIIYIDPVGGAIAFSNQPAPDIILLTHTHNDHLSVKTLEAVSKNKTLIIAPMAVADMVPNTVPGTLLVAKNGQKTNQQGFKIEVIPAYNLATSKNSYHKKGEGNGYVLEVNSKRVYISGDTDNIPEVRSLENIDVAFISMNLPYTMSVEKAVEAVLQFKPKQVYPYHYKTSTGFSEVAKFKEIVNSKDPAIEVVQLDWYPKS
jgi:L-ascorbate metabolism protein UlaG (beta-lactamase superfamily)